MKTVLSILILIVVYAFIAETSIKFNPFKIEFQRPYMAIGWIFIAIGFFFVSYQAEQTGFKKGVKETMQLVTDVVNESKRADVK